MKLATWNVNSLRVRLPQVLDWLAQQQPDLIGLQETKLQDAQFPAEALQEAGYHSIYSGQKTYNGVAVLSREPLEEADSQRDLPDFDDPQRRLLAVTCQGIRFINVYVPNGSELGSDKFQYKLDWLDALHGYLQQQLLEHESVVLVGDFNIAPDNPDVHDPALWENTVLFSKVERQKFQDLLAMGLVDTFRLFEQPDNMFSWWDYRAAAYRRNLGLRIDHILVNQPLSAQCRACYIDKTPRGWERPSDHAPVVLELDT